MEETLFCMTMAYLRTKFYDNLNKGKLDTSAKYMQYNSDILYIRMLINFHTFGYKVCVRY